MKRYLSLALALIALATITLGAQGAPAGWKQRIDRSTNASDPDPAGDVKFMSMAGGFHAINPQAATYWNPANTATGNYTIKATFTQNEKSSHTNYYGIVFGGKDMDGANQTYNYFTVAQNGTFLIKQRTGADTKDLAPRAPNAAVKQLGADGKSVNDLEVRVTADKVDYVVNGTVVHSMPKAGLNTDGVYGLRVNHALNVSITGLAASK